MTYFRWHGEITNVDLPERHYRKLWWMVEGKPVEGWDGNLVGNYDDPARLGLKSPRPQFNYGLALNGWPIFSSPFKKFLDHTVPGLIQFLPFRLEWGKKRSRQAEVCHVGQFLRLVDCLDRGRTVVENNWKSINEFGDFGIRWPAVLNQNAIGEDKLFRVRGYSLCIIIREDLKRLIESNGFTNQRFDSIEVV